MDLSWDYKEVKNWSLTDSIYAIMYIFSRDDGLQC